MITDRLLSRLSAAAKVIDRFSPALMLIAISSLVLSLLLRIVDLVGLWLWLGVDWREPWLRLIEIVAMATLILVLIPEFVRRVRIGR